MKTNIYNALNNKTKDVLKESQNVQLDFKAGLKDKVSRQARYIDNNLSDDQVEEIVNDPEVSKNYICKCKILSNNALGSF